MSDGQSFILLLSAFYLWESIYWVRPQTSGFVRIFIRWKLSIASDFLSGRKKTILFNPWPSALFPQCIAAELPFQLSSEELILNDALSISWDQLELKQDAASLYLKPKYKLELPDAHQAAGLLKLLRELQQAATEQRGRLIELFYNTHLSSTRSKRLIQRAKSITKLLRFNGLCLTLLFFAIVPYSYITQKETVFHFTLLAAFCFVIYQALIAFFATKRLYPGNIKQRWVVALSTLFPWQAMHVGQQLMSNALPRQHPLAVSAALLPQNKFHQQLSTYWRRLKYIPQNRISGPYQAALDSFFTREGIEIDTLFQPPLKSGTQTASYCPCCHAEFREDFSTCSDCRDVALIPFKKP